MRSTGVVEKCCVLCNIQTAAEGPTIVSVLRHGDEGFVDESRISFYDEKVRRVAWEARESEGGNERSNGVPLFAPRLSCRLFQCAEVVFHIWTIAGEYRVMGQSRTLFDCADEVGELARLHARFLRLHWLLGMRGRLSSRRGLIRTAATVAYSAQRFRRMSERPRGLSLS